MADPQLRTKEVLWDWYTSLSSKVFRPPAESTFATTGTITPKEFVEAGDLLVYKSGSWSWSGGEVTKRIPELPADKQFLIARNVPCNPLMRESAKSSIVDDDWLSMEPQEDESNQVVDVKDNNSEEDEEDQDGEAADAETFAEEDNVVEDADPSSKTDIIRTRTYDVTICYDTYHHVPHVWLFGYDKSGHPLKPQLMYEDISKDHVGETVTIKPHPHLLTSYASIHPCRHAEVMKRIVSNMTKAGKEPRADLYLFIFLKFLSAVIPSMEYDNTFELDINLRSVDEEPKEKK